MDALARDLRYALTVIRRNKSFAAAALLTLALGIGLTTTVYSVIYGVLVKPLPYPTADRLVRIWEEHPGGRPITTDRWISNRTFYAWTKHARAVDVIGGFGTYEYTLTTGGEGARMFGAQVSPDLLAAVGAKAIAGRLFSAREAEIGAESVLVLGYGLWQEAFGGDPHVIGRRVAVDGELHTVVGVLDSRFYFPDRRARFWLPYQVSRVSSDPRLSHRTSGLSAIARMAPGATLAQVEAEGTAAARSVPVTVSTELLFGRGGPPIVHAVPLVPDMTASARPTLLVLAAGVACILLIACANVANLFLSRGIGRQRELALRSAIGAGTSRIVRQLLTEAALFSVAGGVLGTAAAWALIQVLPRLALQRFPRIEDVGLDAHVLFAASGTVLLATVISGLAPAVRGARLNVAEALHGGDGAFAGGFRGPRARRLRDVLLVAEAGFAVMLLVGAALLARSFVRLITVDPGYTADRVLTARVQMPRDSTPERTAAFIDSALTALRATPGVRAAGAGNMMPFLPLTAMTSFVLPPSVSVGEPSRTRQMTYTVTPGYAEAVGLRLREGRLFSERDATSGIRSMIVNDEFVRRYLSSTPAVGRRFRNLLPNEKGVDTEIVGVVGTVLKDGNDRRPEPEVYFVHGAPNQEIEMRGAVNFLVRTAADPAAMAPTVRRVFGHIDRGALIERVDVLTDRLSASVAQPRFATTVLALFALTASLLAAIGLYGVLSYTVSQRQREFGVRAALGASRPDLLRLVIREGLSVTLVGLAIGLVASAALTRFMQSVLFGVAPLDAVSFTAAPIILFVVALGACAWPAVRAASVEPMEALRRE